MIGNVIGTTSEIPDKVSQLENDAGYGTQKGIDAALEVANSALFERIVIASSNGLAFKNGEGSTIIAAAVYRGSTSITNNVTLKWKQDGTEVATGVNYITVEGSSVSEKSIVTVEAYDENNKLLTVESVTLLDVFDGAQGLQGIQGKQGIQGIQGEPGAQGKSSYFHIKYSTVPNPASAGEMTESPSEYIGTYVDFSSTDSTDPSAYTWCRFQGIQGEKGETGIPGKNGTDGKTYYLHIAYATSFDGTKDFSISDPVGKTYIGQYTDINTVDSTDPTKYKWSRIKGETGKTGVSITSTVDEWYLSTSSESLEGGIWTESREAWSEGHYYWRRVKTSYSDGTTGYTPSELGYYDAAITTAVSNSNEARSTAGNAVNTANAAKSAADSASTTAGQAKSTAETAKSTAEAAKSTADSAKTSADTNARDLANYITKNTTTLTEMQTLIDGSIMTWFFPRPPADATEPTSKWTTTDLKNQHLGDLYYDTDTGYCYRYQVEHQVYSWQRITDVDVTKALADAKSAQDTADGKRRVFTVQPTPPYDVGDLWAAGANGDIKRCRIAKTSEQSYAASDWELASKYTDDTTANQVKDDLTDTINSTESQLDGKITAVDKKATQTATDLNAARDELSSGLADAMAQAQAAAAAAKVAQTDLNNYMNYKVDPQLKTMSDFMAAYNLSFHQDSSGLYITNQNSDGTPADISLRLGNDRISFIQGQGDDAFEVAFISDKQLYITSGEFLNGLRMGNYAFIPGAAGDLSIKKVK